MIERDHKEAMRVHWPKKARAVCNNKLSTTLVHKMDRDYFSRDAWEKN